MTEGAAGAPRSAGSNPVVYRRYVLGLLLFTFTVNYIDRQMLAILLPSIKADLQLSDTQLGFLAGTAFAVFYAVMGIPMGRLTDRVNRRSMIAVVLVVWSVMTALCGVAQNFLQLMLARIGVAVGEAGFTPASHSLISDYFPPERRAMALSIFSSGISLGVLVGFLAGGWINEYFSWRVALVAVGLPGVILAIVIRLTLREPVRGHAEKLVDSGNVPPLLTVAGHLSKRRAYRHFIGGGALTGFAYFSVLQWMPSFLDRTFAMGSAEIGTWLAPIMGLGGGAGALLGGRLVDALSRRDERWYMWLPGSAALIAAPCTLLIFLLQDPKAMLLCLALPVFLFAIHLGPMASAVQGFSPVRMRGVAVAISLFITNILSLGLGPQVVGIVSDALTPRFGADALRYAIPSVAVIALFWSAGHFFFGAPSFSSDLISPIRHDEPD